MVWWDNAVNWAPIWCEISEYLPSCALASPCSLYRTHRSYSVHRHGSYWRCVSGSDHRAPIVLDYHRHNGAGLSSGQIPLRRHRSGYWAGLPYRAADHLYVSNLRSSASVLTRKCTVYFIQGHRFDIYEGYGCIAATPITWLYIVLSGVWPIPIGLVSAFYSSKSRFCREIMP